MLAGLLLALTTLLVPQQDAEEFNKRFDQAIRLSDRVGQDRAVQKYRKEAFNAFMAKVERASLGDEWIDAFAASWKRIYRSDFPEIYAKYHAGLDGEKSSKRGKAIAKLAGLYEVNIRAVGSRQAADWQELIDGIEGSGLLFELMEVEDKYYQAIAQMFLASAHNTEYRKDGGGDDFQALKAAEAFLKLRDELQLTNDAEYGNVERLLAEIRARLGIEDPKKEEHEAKASPFAINPAEGAEWVDIPLSNEVLEKPETVELPSDVADMDTRHWLFTTVNEAGKMYNFSPSYSGDDLMWAGQRGPVQIERIRGNKFVIHAGADPSEEFTLKTKPELVEFEQKLSDGEVVRRALLVAGGAEQDQFQGIQVNTGMTEGGGVIFYRSVSIRTGETPFGEIALYDADSDGQYGRIPPRYGGSWAMPKETYYQRFDGITLGKMKAAVPFSKWITDGAGNWFELEFPQHLGTATHMRMRQAAPTLGTLEVDFGKPKGLELVSLILKADSKVVEGLMIDVSGKGPFEVPIGRYSVVQGLLRGDDGEECLLLPPGDIPMTVIVDEGEPAVLELGKPFKLVAEPLVEGDSVTIDPESLRVVGVAGEMYLQHLYAPLRDIEVQVKGGKKFTLEAPDADTVAGDWHTAYFPAPTLGELPKSGEVTLRLSVKKHPWFGKLTSDWLGDID